MTFHGGVTRGRRGAGDGALDVAGESVHAPLAAGRAVGSVTGSTRISRVRGASGDVRLDGPRLCGRRGGRGRRRGEGRRSGEGRRRRGGSGGGYGREAQGGAG